MGPNQEAFKKIFDYMLDCVSAGKSVPYPLNEIHPFTKYPIIIDAARRLRMNQLEDGLAARAKLLGRKKLIDIPEAENILEHYYCSTDDKMYDIAVESIAYGWYDNRFKKEDHYDLDVGWLRENYPVFDELLSKKIEKIPGEIQETKEAARARKAERQARERGEAGDDDSDGNAGVGRCTGEGWAEDNTKARAVGSFQSADITPDIGIQDSPARGQSWAAEPEVVATVANIHGPSSGW